MSTGDIQLLLVIFMFPFNFENLTHESENGKNYSMCMCGLYVLVFVCDGGL